MVNLGFSFLSLSFALASFCFRLFNRLTIGRCLSTVLQPPPNTISMKLKVHAV